MFTPQWGSSQAAIGLQGASGAPGVCNIVSRPQPLFTLPFPNRSHLFGLLSRFIKRDRPLCAAGAAWVGKDTGWLVLTLDAYLLKTSLGLPCGSGGIFNPFTPPCFLHPPAVGHTMGSFICVLQALKQIIVKTTQKQNSHWLSEMSGNTSAVHLCIIAWVTVLFILCNILSSLSSYHHAILYSLYS